MANGLPPVAVTSLADSLDEWHHEQVPIGRLDASPMIYQHQDLVNKEGVRVRWGSHFTGWTLTYISKNFQLRFSATRFDRETASPSPPLGPTAHVMLLGLRQVEALSSNEKAEIVRNLVSAVLSFHKLPRFNGPNVENVVLDANTASALGAGIKGNLNNDSH